MHHYFEAITNTSGDSLVGYFARVIDPVTSNAITMSADDNGTPIVTKSGVENMGSTDDYGNLDFYVVPGTYHLDIYAPNATSFIFRVPNVAMNSTKGDTGAAGRDGEIGPAGAANSTYATLALLKDAPVSNGSYTLLQPSRQEFSYVAGNFSALINDIDFIALNGTPATTGALVSKRSDRSTMARFGAQGDGTTNDTVAVQNAVNWSSATKQPVFGIGAKGNTFLIDKFVLKAFTQIIGDHKRGSSFKARPLTTIPTGYYGLMEIDESTVIECRLEDFRLDLAGGVNAGQMGFYAFARPNSNPAVYQNGGLWYSTFIRVNIIDASGHAVWFRGGSNDLDSARNPIPGQYSFLLPHQFNTFHDCEWKRGGNAGSTAICMTGQCGQFMFDSCYADGFNLEGFNISAGREFVGGGREQLLISGAGLFAGAFVSPGFITFTNLTTQGSLTAVLSDGSNINVQGYFENLKRSITNYGGTVTVNDSTFQNAGSFGGNGWLLYTDGGNITGDGNVFGGTTDRITVREAPGVGRLNVEMIGPYTAGKTVGTWLGTGVQTNGTVELANSLRSRVSGSATGCVSINSGLLPGEWQEIVVPIDTANPLIFLSSGVLEVPGGRLVLRGGDTCRVTRFEETNKFIFDATIGELKAGAMPTSGLYVDGEFVRNVNTTTLTTGGIAFGWVRLTTGSAHVAGTDWRTIQVTGV